MKEILPPRYTKEYERFLRHAIKSQEQSRLMRNLLKTPEEIADCIRGDICIDRVIVSLIVDLKHQKLV